MRLCTTRPYLGPPGLLPLEARHSMEAAHLILGHGIGPVGCP